MTYLEQNLFFPMETYFIILIIILLIQKNSRFFFPQVNALCFCMRLCKSHVVSGFQWKRWSQWSQNIVSGGFSRQHEHRFGATLISV